MKKLLLVALVLGGFGCAAKVSVVCVGKEDAIDCTLAEVSGSKKLHTCWDTTFKCDNGTKPTLNTCDDVVKDKPTVHTLKLSDFKADKCDKLTPNSLAVEHIKFD